MGWQKTRNQNRKRRHDRLSKGNKTQIDAVLKHILMVGKYRGLTLGAVKDLDPGYLEWMSVSGEFSEATRALARAACDIRPR